MEVNLVTKREIKNEENIRHTKRKMSVSEAGHLGGQIGGPRVRELIQEGKEHEKEFRRSAS
jgi:hypothetical protein